MGSEELGGFPSWLGWVEVWILRVSMAVGVLKCLQMAGSPQRNSAGEGTCAALKACVRAITHMLQMLCAAKHVWTVH